MTFLPYQRAPMCFMEMLRKQEIWLPKFFGGNARSNLQLLRGMNIACFRMLANVQCLHITVGDEKM
jgi:hypothetical protein